MYQLHFFFTNKQIYFSFLFPRSFLQYNIRNKKKPFSQKYLLVSRHVYNVLPSQTLHYIEKVFTPGALPGVRSGLTARRLFDLALIKLGKLEFEIISSSQIMMQRRVLTTALTRTLLNVGRLMWQSWPRLTREFHLCQGSQHSVSPLTVREFYHFVYLKAGELSMPRVSSPGT